jgi:hypothetical protein
MNMINSLSAMLLTVLIATFMGITVEQLTASATLGCLASFLFAFASFPVICSILGNDNEEDEGDM